MFEAIDLQFLVANIPYSLNLLADDADYQK